MMVNGKNFILLNKVFHPEEVISGYDNVTVRSIDDIKDKICDFRNYSCSCVSNKKVEVLYIFQDLSAPFLRFRCQPR